MKELSTEQKAKAYDLAIDAAKKYHNGTLKDVMETIFPELKEMSEGERVRKAILNYFIKCWGNCKDDVCGIHVEDAIAWLEKQKEQKPVIEMKSPEESLGISSKEYNNIINDCLYGESKPIDNVEPKFKYGDRVRNKKSGLEQTLGGCIEDVYEGTFPFRIKDQDDWELVEQKPVDKVEPKFNVGDWINPIVRYVGKQKEGSA